METQEQRVGLCGEKSDEAVQFLEKLIDRTAMESRSPLRRMMRLNGFIQWLTILLCWLILVVCCERFLRVRRAVNPDDDNRSNVDGESLSEELLDRRVYQPYEFMIALLPTLGFIGTVMGMGDALLSADGLFSAQDKGNALGTITQHLGFAFDTTLVGLVTGMIAGARRWYCASGKPASGRTPSTAAKRLSPPKWARRTRRHE